MVIPDRSTLSGGLAGVVAWGASLVLAHFGMVISPEILTPAIIGLITLVVHFVPDAAKIDQTIKDVGAILPQTYSSPEDFPNAPKSGTPNNLMTKSG